MMQQRVAILGLGKIGTILLQGMLKAGLPPGNVRATVRHAERTRGPGAPVPVPVDTDNRAAVRGADVVLIAVKPQNVRELLEEIRGEMVPSHLVLPAAAPVPRRYMAA